MPWRGTAPMPTRRDVAHQHRHAVALRHHDLADVVGRSQQPDAAHDVLLFAALDVAAAGVGVAATQRGEDLLHRDAERSHLHHVEVHLVLFDEAAEADDVGDARRHAQVALDRPVLDRTELGRGGAVAGQPVAIDLADRRRQRRELRLEPGRQLDALQPLEHLLAREVVVDLIVEGQDQERQAELGVREHPHRMGKPAQSDLQRDRDLLLDFLRRVARHQRDHGDLHVGHVGKRFDRQRAEALNAGADEQHRQQRHQQRLPQRE